MNFMDFVSYRSYYQVVVCYSPHRAFIVWSTVVMRPRHALGIHIRKIDVCYLCKYKK